MLACVSCREDKDEQEFSPDKRRPSGRKSYCRPCHTRLNAKWVNREKRPTYILRNRYGLTLEDYEDLLQEQNGGCAICEASPPENRRLSVDHCHKTGKIRGLLCNKCNCCLGMVDDNIDRLFDAIAYLRKWG